MKDCNLGDYLEYDGKLMKCIGVNDGHKEVILESLEDKFCYHCNKSLGKEQIHVIVQSRNFQDNAKELQTIKI